jgi:hypothetical protein
MEKKRPRSVFEDQQEPNNLTSTEDSVYSSMNNEYKRLFLERLNRSNTNPPNDTLPNSDVHKTEPKEAKLNETVPSRLQTNYYINKLRVYPKEEYTEYMRSFREFL